MPFCPHCKSEYLPGIGECADCRIPLVSELPVETPVEYDECGHCGEAVTRDSDFCVHCGAVVSEGNFLCSLHPGTTATAVCVICRRLMCERCAKEKQGKMMCEEHNGVEVSEDWALAFQSVDYYEANIVRGKLESGGFTVNPRNNTSIGFIADGFIDSAIGRSILRYPVKVYVPFDQYLQAIEFIKDESPLNE